MPTWPGHTEGNALGRERETKSDKEGRLLLSEQGAQRFRLEGKEEKAGRAMGRGSFLFQKFHHR